MLEVRNSWFFTPHYHSLSSLWSRVYHQVPSERPSEMHTQLCIRLVSILVLPIFTTHCSKPARRLVNFKPNPNPNANMDFCLTREDFAWHGIEQLRELPQGAAIHCPICLDNLVNTGPSSSSSSETEAHAAHNDGGSRSETAGTSAIGTNENSAANQITASASVEANPEQTPFVRTRACGHTFHTKCLQEWLSTKQTCPMCRKTLFFLSYSPDDDQDPPSVPRLTLVEVEMPQMDQDPTTALSTVLLVAVVWGCFGLMAAIVVVLLLAYPTICRRRHLPRP